MANEDASGQVTAFERIRRTDEGGDEFWSACELAGILVYSDWRTFLHTINNAREACENSGFAA